MDHSNKISRLAQNASLLEIESFSPQRIHDLMTWRMISGICISLHHIHHIAISRRPFTSHYIAD